jgi:IBR domain, a half RING-finger domain
MNIEASSECCNCLEIKQCEYILDCSHCICTETCFKDLVSEQISNRLENYAQLACPKCQAKIPKAFLLKIYHGEQNFRNQICLSSKKFEPKITCKVCYIDKESSEFITLNCDHRFCKICLDQIVNILLNKKQIGQQICCPDCKVIVDYSIIYQFFNEDLKMFYDKFLDRRLQATLNNEVYIICIGKTGNECRYGQFISSDRAEYTCPKCGVSFCAKCKDSPHPKLSCAQFKASKESPYIKYSIEKGLASYCPWCDNLMFKDRSCTYTACKSEVCNGKRGFCWECKAKFCEEKEILSPKGSKSSSKKLGCTLL